MGYYARMGKRVFDVCSATALLVVASPIMALTAFVIWLDDRGPPIFRQTRVGRDGQPFTLRKFRSMPVGTANVPSDAARTIQPTRVGRIIRRTNIDELPQLFNVVRGEMSVVGPRPALPAQVDLLTLRRDNGALRCRPGLTGLAQVSAYDGMPVPEKAAYDGRYAANVTLASDVVILARTIGYLTRRPPVY